MKKLMAALALSLFIGGFAAQAQDRKTSAPSTSIEKIDRETRDLVKKVWPAFVHIGGGSGVCISEDGYFLTNHHVYNDAPKGMVAKTSVRMAGNSRKFTAIPVGADPRGDIVLGKIVLEKGEKVPFARLADSEKVQIGDLCLSIGDPFLLSGGGSEPTITLGTVTAKNRFQGGYCDCIQIDTAINPGNSGGPSFNMDGEIIGINGRNIASHGKRFNTGAGYAIPANQIRHFMDALKAQEGGAIVVRHGLVSGLKISLGAKAEGAVVEAVEPETEASDAGFQAGDVIVKMDDSVIFNAFRYYGVVGTKPRGSTFKFMVKRGDKTVELSARNDLPTESGQFGTIPRSDEEARRDGGGGIAGMMDPFKLPTAKSSLGIAKGGWKRNPDRKVGGFIMLKFDKVGGEQSPLEAAGLQVNDILISIGGRRIHFLCDVSDILISVDAGTPLLVKYIRDGQEAEVTVITAARP